MTNVTYDNGNGSNVVAIVAVVILVGLAILFFMYGLPILQRNAAQPQPQQPGASIQINTPPISSSSPSGY